MSGIMRMRASGLVVAVCVAGLLCLGVCASAAYATDVQTTTTTVFTGRVVDELGLALPGALVGIYALESSDGANPQLRGYALSNGSGYFTVEAVGDPLSGRYYYQVTANGRDSNTWGYADSTALGELRLFPRPDILVGKVTRHETGDPVPLVRVELSTHSGSWGGAAFGGPEGSFNVGCDTQPAGAGVYTAVLTDYQVPATFTAATYEFYWAPGMDAVVHDFVVRGPIPIMSGIVADSDTDLPIEGVAVDASILETDTGQYVWGGTEWTDSEGSYSVRDEAGLGAGEWMISWTAHRYASRTATLTWDGVDELPGDTRLDLRAPSVTGIVTDRLTCEPVVDAAYVLDYAMFEDNWYDQDRGVSDASGSFAAWGYSAGHFRLRVDAEGYASQIVEFDWDGTTTTTLVIELLPYAKEVAIEGSDRFKTAVEASKLAFPKSGQCSVAVVASGRNFPDALGASSLAGALGGPLLLTEPAYLPSSVSDEIVRLGCTKVVIVGGHSAVSEVTEAAIDKLPGVVVERVEGDNRYATAQKVAERTFEELGVGYGGVVFLATGTNFPDALAAAPLSASGGVPILLVKKDDVPVETIAAFNNIQPGHVVVLGGESAIDRDVFEFFRGYFPGIQRVWGTNRYATAAAVAQFGVNNLGLRWDGVAIATGANFPDALAGGTAQGLAGSVVMLTDSGSLAAEPRTKLVTNAADIAKVRFLGGNSAVAPAVRQEILDVVNASKNQ